MGKIILTLLTSCLVTFANCQQGYWQQEVNYTIDVTLNDKEHSLTGFEKIEYINNSPDTLKFIWIHLWPNAYKNDKTALNDQLLENGNTKFYFSSEQQRGYINKLDFKVNNVTAELQDHPNHIDIAKLVLPTPLAPGQAINISTPFHVKLPFNFSRGGHVGETYQLTQWYPKPAVYDKTGWHEMPYLSMGEYYSDFGSFDVRITVPQNYVVAATGELQDETEKQWLKARKGFEWKPIPLKEKTAGTVKTVTQYFPKSSDQTKTIRYKQTKVHDFAWFADKRFIVDVDTCQLSTGKIIDVYTYYTSAYKDSWEGCIHYAKNAVRHFTDEVGEYPYNVVSVVQGPQSFGGGMEYPTITVISPLKDKVFLNQITAHEIGHNWFYGILASNERDYPWMDEGMNSYFDDRYYKSQFGGGNGEEKLLFLIKSATHSDQPIATASKDFTDVNYAVVPYYKTAEWLRYMESQLGEAVFLKAMKKYYEKWKFKHPQPADFRAVMEEVAGRSLENEFSYLNKKGNLPNQQLKGTRFGFVFKSKFLQQNVKQPVKNLILVGPAIGFNSYDKLLAGAFITNFKLPPNPFQFLFVPMYGIGSKRFNGLGSLNYKFYPGGMVRKVEFGLNAQRFTMNEFNAGDSDKVYMSFEKLVPSVKLTFREKNPRSTLLRYLQFKTFLIGEDELNFYRDTVLIPGGYELVDKYNTKRENRVLNQLQLVFENNRALYPFKAELKGEQAKGFIRTSLTGHYHFNYTTTGGLNVRLFAGKFIYTKPKTVFSQFENDRYHLNLTGPNGYEDYTYSDYFLGRNKFEGFASQQIMMRDGGFKVRTDLLSEKVGRSDDWLAAVNLSSSIPTNLNPFSMLPFNVPIKIFVDIGTSANAWKKDADMDRFLYDAGVQLSFFHETINFYLPLVYSGVFKDYIKSTLEKKGRIWKTVSFTIDISNFSFRNIDRHLDF